MEAELKQALIDKIKLAQDDVQNPSIVKAILQEWCEKLTSRSTQNALNVLYDEVQKKLLNARLWKQIQAELARESFERFLKQLLIQQKAEAAGAIVSAARERQLSLFPGFESLPVRVRAGKKYVNLPDLTVSQFVSYAGKYLAKIAHNRRTAEDLERLVEIVQPLIEQYPNMALSDAFARQSRKVATLPPVEYRR